MKVSYYKFFSLDPNGAITITRPIKIGGVTLSNVTFGKGVKIGEIDLFTLYGKELEVEDVSADVVVIKGYYN